MTECIKKRVYGAIVLTFIVGAVCVLFYYQGRINASPIILVIGWAAVVVSCYFIGKSLWFYAMHDERGLDLNPQYQGRHADLLREKKAVLRAIKDTEFDCDMGKISQEDAEAIIMVYRKRAIEVLRALEESNS